MPGERHAVLIGNSTYPAEPRLARLRCPEKDIAGIQDRLTSAKFGLFAPANILLLANAPSYEILEAIERTVRKLSRNDLLLIYYSGHGQCDEAGRLHLAAANTRLDTLGSTSVPIDLIKNYIDLARTNRIVLILDCCYSGAAGDAFMKGGVDQELLEASRGGQGIYIVTASSAIQVAREKEGDQHSLLTKHLLEGLSESEADTDGDGFVSMDELYSYVQTNVRLEGAQQPIKFAVKVQGDLLIARSGKAPREERRKQIRSHLLDLASKGLITDILLEQTQKANSLDPKGFPRESQRQVELLDQLLDKRIEVGQFIERWYNVGASSSIPIAQTATHVFSPSASLEQSLTIVLRRTLPRQPGGLLAGALSPRGGILATGSGSGTVWFWDTHTGELKAQSQGSTKPVWAVAFSPDGASLASGSGDGLLRILSWHGELLRALDGISGSILALAYSPDGTQIVTGGTSDSLTIHTLSDNRTDSIPTGHGQVNRVLFLEEQIISAGHDGFIRLWDAATGSLEKSIPAHNDAIYALSMSANGQLLISGGRDGMLRLWDTSSWCRQGVLRGHTDSVLSAAVHANGKTIVSGSADGSVRFWDAAGQNLTASAETGHISVNFALFAPDGGKLITGGADQTVRFWKLAASRASRSGI